MQQTSSSTIFHSTPANPRPQPIYSVYSSTTPTPSRPPNPTQPNPAVVVLTPRQLGATTTVPVPAATANRSGMVTPVSRYRLRPRPPRVAVSSEIPLLATTRRTTTRQQPQPHQQPAETAEPAVPSNFLCPISLELMRDPVTAPTGITYDRCSVEAWLDRGHATCPVTSRPLLRAEDLIPNHATRRMIQDWCVAHRVDRVPTPRVPLSPADSADLLHALSSAARRGDADPSACRHVAAKVRALAKESDRNRRCLAAAGAASSLSSAFLRLADQNQQPSLTAVEEILAALVVFFPLGDEARSYIASPASLHAVVSVILSHGGETTATSKASAAVVLREVASSSNTDCLDAMSETDGIHDALVRLLRRPVSPQATKAALVTAYYLAAHSAGATRRLVELGTVELVVEMLVDADKGTAEKALAVLDGLLMRAEEGRGKACAHALAVPVLVKKMMHVSDMATEFAVSALWRLCKSDEGPCKAEEALQLGAFQKLLLLLQVGCMGVTKERASELLRLLNGSRDGVECIETVDFKGLKRPFS